MRYMSNDELEDHVERLFKAAGIPYERSADPFDACDFRVGGWHLDCKGSTDHKNGSLGYPDDYKRDEGIHDGGDPIAYCTNQLVVVEFEQVRRRHDVRYTSHGPSKECIIIRSDMGRPLMRWAEEKLYGR